MDLSSKDEKLLGKINRFEMMHEFTALLVVVGIVLVLLILINVFDIKEIFQYLFPVAVLMLGFTYLSTVRMLGERDDLIRKLSGYIERLERRR